MMSRKPNQEYYDQFAEVYEHERHHGYHALIDELEVAVALRYAGGGRVLEAGCGTGLILKEVRPHVAEAVGLDLSPGMLAVARGRGLPVVHGSVTDLPFPDAHFDLAYSFKVLAHVEAIERALAEMARVVRPGGHVVAEFYNPYSLRGLVKRWKAPTPITGDTHDHAVYTRYDTLADVKRYLPPGLSIGELRGVRVVTPVSGVHDVPLLGPLVRFLERRAATAPGLRRLGGFMVVVAKKQ